MRALLSNQIVDELGFHDLRRTWATVNVSAVGVLEVGTLSY